MANALDAPASGEMGEPFADLRDDPDLRVAIMTGVGEKFFSGRWDLNAVAEDRLRAAPLALVAVNEAVHLTDELTFEEGYAALRPRSWPAFMKMLRGEGAREGGSAFVEKREPESEDR